MVLSRNIVFDESSMIRSQAEFSSEAEKGSNDKQVELQDDHKVVDLSNHIENQEEQAEDIKTEAQPPEATRRSIAKDRQRRVDVRPQERYRFEDMVGYALQVT